MKIHIHNQHKNRLKTYTESVILKVSVKFYIHFVITPAASLGLLRIDLFCKNFKFCKIFFKLFFLFDKETVTFNFSVPLTVCFPDYSGENNFEDASEFIKAQYENLNKSKTDREIYSHLTCATDTTNIQVNYQNINIFKNCYFQVIFDCVSDVILKNYLSDCGLI
jgi:hypothetical protein